MVACSLCGGPFPETDELIPKGWLIVKGSYLCDQCQKDINEAKPNTLTPLQILLEAFDKIDIQYAIGKNNGYTYVFMRGDDDPEVVEDIDRESGHFFEFDPEGEVASY